MNRAFSLVELAIVLVILGLITGGILSGKALIRGAGLKSIPQNLANYEKAVGLYRDTYKALPGDHARATQIWGSVGGGSAQCVTPITDVGTGTETCNGNGDGVIGGVAAAQRYENHRFWQHLSNAGMIEGRYTGVQGSGGLFHVVPGTNAPMTSLSRDSGYSYWNIGNITNTAHASNFVGDYSQMFQVGMKNSTNRTLVSLFRPKEVWSIDVKVDDGVPAYGKIRQYKGTYAIYGVNCTTSDDPDAAKYLMTSEVIGCSLIYLPTF